jgi:hypothetical protein
MALAVVSQDVVNIETKTEPQRPCLRKTPNRGAQGSLADFTRFSSRFSEIVMGSTKLTRPSPYGTVGELASE